MTPKTGWRSPVALLILMSIAMPIAFNTWNALLNNFVVERAAFTGVEIGILQSLREVPGFLAFTTVFVLLLIREQTFAVLSLAILGIGVAATGFFPTVYGLYFTTVVMSLGFHYFEAVKQSLSLQWLSKEEAPQVLGKLISVASITSLIVYGVLWILLEIFQLDYSVEFHDCRRDMCGPGGRDVDRFSALSKARRQQHSHLVLRKRYWLVLRADLLLRGPSADLHGLRSVPDGGEIRLHGSPGDNAVPDQLRVQLAVRGKDRCTSSGESANDMR